MLAKTYDKEIESIMEFSEPDDSILPSATAWTEESPIMYTYDMWDTIAEYYLYNKLSFSYHHLSVLLYLMDEYEQKTFYFLNENGEEFTENVDIYYSFNNETYATTKKQVFVPKNTEFQIYVKDYQITNTEKANTYILTALEKNTIEVYVKQQENDSDSYVTVKEGTLHLKNLIFNEITSKSLENSYAAISRVNSTLPYKIEFEDSLGVRHNVNSILARNTNGEHIELLQKDGSFIIPNGFKNNLYIGMTIYIS